MMHSTDIDESPGFVLYLHNKGLVNKSSFIKYTKKKISLVNGNIYKYIGSNFQQVFFFEHILKTGVQQLD